MGINKTMPYDNPYNRRIANELGSINERFATLYAYSPVDGRAGYAEGGSNAGVLFQTASASKRDGEDNIYNNNYTGDMKLPEVYYWGQDSEGMRGGNGFAEGSFRDTGEGHQMGASAVGHFDKGAGMSGGNLWTDIYHGFEDLGSDIGSAVDYVIGSGKPDAEKARMLGRLLAHAMKGKGMMVGGSWWSSLKDGISDVVGFLPELAIHAIAGAKPKKAKKMKGGDLALAEITPPTGGAILGNPDPYPVQGDSNRVAGRGRPKKMKGGAILGTNGDLLAMPSVALPNGVPAQEQLRGSYGGGAKPSAVEAKVMKAVAKKLKGGKNLSGMTDKRAEMEAPKVGGDGRKKRAEIVKKIMKEKGLKMIEASKYVKEHKLY